MQKWLVIDASVAHDASPTRSIPRCMNCYEVLELVKTQGYFVVMTPFILEEWDHEQSLYALTWRGEMTSRRRLRVIDAVTIKDTCLCIRDAVPDKVCMKEMIKDFPLIMAALKKDRIVISLDKLARKYFARASEIIIEIKSIVWIDPDREEDKSVYWLKDGAKPEIERQLGHFF
jgi:hypothetical protein